jgi:DNA-binding MarR family transcriptional regulator
MKNREKQEMNNITTSKISNEIKCCEQCPNHCPVNALHCSRGKEFFGEAGQMAEGREELGNREKHEGHSRHEGHTRKRQQEEYSTKDSAGAWQQDGIDSRTHMRHSCGQGRENRFEHEHKGRRKRREIQQQDNLYGSLRMCGHYLYHRGESGRGSTQERILSILFSEGQMSQRKLQELLQIQPGSISEILTKLEMKGLLERRKDDTDKRRMILSLTEAGQAAAYKSDCSFEEEALFAALTGEEQTTLKMLLDKLLASWR